MLTLNNPLVLVSAKLLGVGVELRVEHVDDVWHLCLDIEAIAWSYCKAWGK
jgi:hypothetical protein